MAFEKLGSKFSEFFSMDPDEDDAAETPEQDTATAPTAAPTANHQNKPKYRGNKVVAMGDPADKTARIVVYEPRIYSDAKEIGNHLLNNKAVVVNFDQIKAEDATRIVDFLTGTVFAINGEIRRVGEMIFLVTPANFQIDGTLASTLGTDSDLDMTN
ncbi:cell division protein SepF [Lacticaseibacillus camelliae]|uniref:Cell division protein SepF n=1 Tax=Lacticaseibacillus camelliae DSM 22697 = JCM 13995 TaxID=1423730 RepID=A0A0R2FE12_9LACO|nr:cell division protein SepF [Lacticaseibacillus camelliae]KRN25579.1 cell division protein sepf [Lacticaseibacillus camelliae DSM 22697 = JCM 13995]